jgi:hypothetical protein
MKKHGRGNETKNPIDEAPLLKETGYRYIMLK